jgi:hypothetical protein
MTSDPGPALGEDTQDSAQDQQDPEKVATCKYLQDFASTIFAFA